MCAIGVSQRVTGAAFALTFILLASANAHAQTPEAIHLEYRVPGAAECPSRDAFSAAIGERATVLLVEPSLASRVFEVEITRISDGAFEGSLIVQAGGGVTRRAVRGKSCAEVASALGFVAALAVDATRRAVVPKINQGLPASTRPHSPAKRPWLDAGLSLGGVYGVMPSIAPLV